MMSHSFQERPQEKNSKKKLNKSVTDFSKVGGLSNHIKILRDVIIVPLLYNNVYSHFNVKTPRGVLFYGPPGTGKTLVAGALATEINKEGLGKVSFFQRKGADVLDKWVGESERKLRTLFEQAIKNRPSIIFFDELDGLAPIRSVKNDHVHCSIVTTLLALMDGLDSVPGVIVIGATNRIESVDPALRRPGRFDRELYFPLPSTEARKEILQVHMQSWKNKPTSKFVTHLAELTTCFCGSDLQALCAETLLCCIKRLNPNIQKSALGAKVKIEADEVKIDECDFLNARKNIIPSSQKLGNKMRKLNSMIAPLLERQLNGVLSKLQMLWPHFFVQFYKYLIGSERYIGRVVLTGSNLQGLNSHLVPAILQNFEHIPIFCIDGNTIQNRTLISSFCQNLPSVLVITRIDELWNCIDTNDQAFITSYLEDIHAGLPILIIATCEEELPLLLQNYFYNNTTVIVAMENPVNNEIEEFFTPLFFGDSAYSLSSILSSTKRSDKNTEHYKRGQPVKYLSNNIHKIKPQGKIKKSRSNCVLKNSFKLNTQNDFLSSNNRDPIEIESLCTLCGTAERKKRLALILTHLLKQNIHADYRKKPSSVQKTKSQQKYENIIQSFGDSEDTDKQKIYNLYRRTVYNAAKDMPVAHLEVLYDTVSACISIYKENFENLVKNLEEILIDIEHSK